MSEDDEDKASTSADEELERNLNEQRKNEREASGRLMIVIKALISSADSKQRDHAKDRLEKDYKKCDAKLESLVRDHYEDITSSIQSFSKISSRLTNTKDRLAKLKYNLDACKSSFHCQRDELRKLWIEGIEHKESLLLLDKIEEIKETPQKLKELIRSKKYLRATELLTNSVNVLNQDLMGVEALRELRMDLQLKKEQLHEVLIQECHHQVYHKSAIFAQNAFKRGGSFRGSGRRDVTATTKTSSLLEQATVASSVKKTHSRSGSRTLARIDFEDEAAPSSDDPGDNPEENSVQYMTMLVESLSVLGKVVEAVDAFKAGMQPQMMRIVRRATKDIIQGANERGDNMDQNQPRLLLDLLEVCFEKFRCVAVAHVTILSSLRKIKNTTNPDLELYDMKDVWSKIQVVFQGVLSDYLDVQNTTSTNQQSKTFTETTSDIASYFSKRKPVRPKNTLFKFELSSHAISMNNYLRELKQPGLYGTEAAALEKKEEAEEMENSTAKFVCQPSSRNITVVFNTLRRFVKEIESNIGFQPGSSCTLHEFISDYIKDVFLGQVHFQIHSSIEAALKGVEGSRSLANSQLQKTTGHSRPLLLSTVVVDQALAELRELVTDLPAYTLQFFNMIMKILQDYKETCHSIYRGVVQPETEEKRIISATWVKDEDIARCLRSLPNWIILQQQPKTRKEETSQTIVETAEDIALRNAKESELLIGNLGDALIPQHEVLLESSELKLLANLHESLQWFAGRIQLFVNGVIGSNVTVNPTMALDIRPAGNLPEIPSETLYALLGLVQEFVTMSETCLLVLHLEVRVHCFYFLMPIAKQANYLSSTDVAEPEPNIISLNRDLAAIEEVINSSLQSHKLKYIFEGLSHLMAAILTNSIQYIKRINENGLKKICRNIFTLQQNLSNITMSREPELDKARQYYELMYQSSDEILDQVVEQGAMFSFQEYVNLLNLQQRSQPGSDHKELETRLQRLQEFYQEAL